MEFGYSKYLEYLYNLNAVNIQRTVSQTDRLIFQLMEKCRKLENVDEI